MFARFRNLFSKNKTDGEIDTEEDITCGNYDDNAETSTSNRQEVNGTSEESSKLEGLNLLKSIVENEQKGVNYTSVVPPSTSLSEEVAELLEKRLSQGEEKLAKEINDLKESENKLNDDKENGDLVKESENFKDSFENQENKEESLDNEVNEESSHIDQQQQENESVNKVGHEDPAQVTNEQKSEELNKNEEEDSKEIQNELNDSQEKAHISEQDNNEEKSENLSSEQLSNENNSETKPDHDSEDKEHNNEQKSEDLSSEQPTNENVSETIEENNDSHISEQDHNEQKSENLSSDQLTNENDSETKQEHVYQENEHNNQQKSEDLSSNNIEEAQRDSSEVSELKNSEITNSEPVNKTKEHIELHISKDEEPIESEPSSLQNHNEVSEHSDEKVVIKEVSEQTTSPHTNEQETSELSNENKDNVDSVNSDEKKDNEEVMEQTTSDKIKDQENSELFKENKEIEQVSEQTTSEAKDNEVSESEELNKSQEHEKEETKENEVSEQTTSEANEVSESEELKKSEEHENEETKDNEVSDLANENKETDLEKTDSEEQKKSDETNESKTSEKENHPEQEVPIESQETQKLETPEFTPLNQDQVTLTENHLEHNESQETNKTNEQTSTNNEIDTIKPSNIETIAPESHEDSPELSESSKSLSQSSVKEIQANSTSPIPQQQDSTTNLSNNSSIVVEDLPSEISTPTPTIDSTISGNSSSNNSTLDAGSVNEFHDPSKIIVNPIDNNGLACSAITNKLSDIAEVAESLDSVIREVQENVQAVEVESNPSPSDKKLGTLRSVSSEDWHSRSTEDDSFATASEGNFTPHSHSSASFQTASGRTSSFVSCDKNSFDASEADDSTYNFEMPELTSPLNMSFEGSEQSYLSAQPLNGEHKSEDKEKTPTKLSETSSQTVYPHEEDQSSIADIEDLHSESVTPTPEDHYDDHYTEHYHIDSIPIESETELEVAGIANAPSLEIITEHAAVPLSKTPEVSLASTSNNCSNQNPTNEALDSNDQQDQVENTNNQNNKSNAAWRRSKYYENITKQTIKGFL